VTTNEPLLSAVPTRTVVPIGTAVQVIGNVAHGPSSCTVDLQQLTGATAWRPVSYWQVRASRRYTLLARPVVLGGNIYRTHIPLCGGWGPYTSAPFAITGLDHGLGLSRSRTHAGPVGHCRPDQRHRDLRAVSLPGRPATADRSHPWRGKSLADVRPSGRYTLPAAPSPGATTYRRLFPRCGKWARASSPPFTIAAT
jgi:hypothetical protein